MERDKSAEVLLAAKEHMRAVAEVRTLGKQLKLELHDALKTAGHNLNYAFSEMDVDRSGTISHDEFRQVSASQGQGRTVLRRSKPF